MGERKEGRICSERKGGLGSKIYSEKRAKAKAKRGGGMEVKGKVVTVGG